MNHEYSTATIFFILCKLMSIIHFYYCHLTSLVDAYVALSSASHERLQEIGGESSAELQLSSKAVDVKKKEYSEIMKRKSVPIFWKKKYEKCAALYWDLFYRRNGTNFYKDRNYLIDAFPELGSGKQRVLLDVGCGVGNAIFPIMIKNPHLFVYALDFSANAISLLRDRGITLKFSQRFEAIVHDLTSLSPIPFEDAGIDMALMIFCLSSIHPSHHATIMKKISQLLRPGGLVFFRDYGRFDEAQLRFTAKSLIEENFYVRGDGTRAFYFDLLELKSLAHHAGLDSLELNYIQQQSINRKEGKIRNRIWIHAKFIKR